MEYLITFNDEWVPDHTAEELREKGTAAQAVIEEMQASGVLIFTKCGLDLSTAVCSVEPVDGQPIFTDGPYVETKGAPRRLRRRGRARRRSGAILGRRARDRARRAAAGAPVPRSRAGPA